MLYISKENKQKIEKLLNNAIDRVSRGFCKRAYAINYAGDMISPDDENAVAWCTLGALGDIGRNDYIPIDMAWKILLDTYDIDSIPTWNDQPERTKEDVIELYKKAIAYLNDPEKVMTYE